MILLTAVSTFCYMDKCSINSYIRVVNDRHGKVLGQKLLVNEEAARCRQQDNETHNQPVQQQGAGLQGPDHIYYQITDVVIV